MCRWSMFYTSVIQNGNKSHASKKLTHYYFAYVCMIIWRWECMHILHRNFDLCPNRYQYAYFPIFVITLVVCWFWIIIISFIGLIYVYRIPDLIYYICFTRIYLLLITLYTEYSIFCKKCALCLIMHFTAYRKLY